MDDQKPTLAPNDKETKELLIAIYLVGLFVVQRLKDGYQKEDLDALVAEMMGDQEFRATVMSGIEGVDKIPAEVKTMAFPEYLDLAKAVLDMVSSHKVA